MDRRHLILNPDLTPLPEAYAATAPRLRDSSNYWLSRETGFDSGFDVFVHSWQLVQTSGTNTPLQRQQRKRDVGLDAGYGTANRNEARNTYGDTINGLYERLTQKLRRSFHAYDDGAWRVNHQVGRWLSDWKRSDQPFFACLHYMEPHIRYVPPGPYYTRHLPAERIGPLREPAK